MAWEGYWEAGGGGGVSPAKRVATEQVILECDCG